MPWTIADVASHNKSVKDKDKPAWVKTANAVRAKCIRDGGTETMCDALAIATANKAVKKLKEADAVKDEKNLDGKGERETRDMRSPELQEVAGMSINDMLDKLRYAVRDKVASPDDIDGPWIKETYDDYLIYEYDGKLYQVSYSFSDGGEPQLGTAAEVIEQTSYIPAGTAAEAASLEDDFVPLVEAFGDDGTFLAEIISPGWGTSGYYSADVLKRDAGIYKEGMPMFWDHPKKADNPERSLRDMAGKLVEDAKWLDNGPKGPGVYARAQAYTPYRAAIKEMREDIGLSHRAAGSRKLGQAEGKRGPIVEKMTAAQSVDFVTAPGRGGAVVELFESARQKAHETYEETRGDQAHDINWGEITLDEVKRSRPDLVEALRSEIKQAVYGQKKTVEEVKRMNDEELKELQEAKDKLEEANAGLTDEIARLREELILKEAREVVVREVSATDLLDITKERLVESLVKKPIVTEGELDMEKYTQFINEAIKKEKDYVATITGIGDGSVRGMGSGGEAGSSEAGKAKLKESFIRLYKSQGHSDEEAGRLAETAVKGR
jgi:hypothetical protein